MKRREFIAVLGGAAAWPLAARAQERPLVAWLSSAARAASLGFVDAFLQGMRNMLRRQGQWLSCSFPCAQ